MQFTHKHISTSKSNLAEVVKGPRNGVRFGDKLGHTLHVDKAFPNGVDT